MEIYHQYIKLRKQFGRHPKLTDEGAEMLADVRPNEEHAAECLNRNPVISVMQCVPEMSEHDANTTAVVYASRAMSHIEGGWPKDIDYTEAEHVIRYRKKVEKDEDYIKTVVALGGAVEDMIKQNNALNIYEQYFSGFAADHSAEVPYAKTVTVFKDPNEIKRNCSYLHWSTDGQHKVAATYNILAFQQQPAGMSLSSYVWDVANPNDPDFEMIPTSQLTCAKFNVKDSNIVAGGQYNGQVSYWDMRKGNHPIESTPIETSHRDPVYDMAWLQSKTGTEFMTTSTDGYVMWWDLRKMSEPQETMPLKDKGSDVLLGGATIEYESTAGPTKFMIGTEQGTILNCNRKAKNPSERILFSLTGHHGPIYGLKRNPFYPKYFMSIGDFTARIWCEDAQMKQPLLSTKYHGQYLTGGTWSPTRPGVFFTTKMDGTLDVWDLFYKHNDPTLQVHVTDKPLTAFAMQEAGAMCAIGSQDGQAYVLQLSPGLVEMAQNEKPGINGMFEREFLREKNLDKFQKEAKIRARREAQREKGDAVSSITPEELGKLEKEFYEATGVAPPAMAAAAVEAAPAEEPAADAGEPAIEGADAPAEAAPAEAAAPAEEPAPAEEAAPAAEEPAADAPAEAAAEEPAEAPPADAPAEEAPAPAEEAAPAAEEAAPAAEEAAPAAEEAAPAAEEPAPAEA